MLFSNFSAWCAQKIRTSKGTFGKRRDKRIADEKARLLEEIRRDGYAVRCASLFTIKFWTAVVEDLCKQYIFTYTAAGFCPTAGSGSLVFRVHDEFGTIVSGKDELRGVFAGDKVRVRGDATVIVQAGGIAVVEDGVAIVNKGGLAILGAGNPAIVELGGTILSDEQKQFTNGSSTPVYVHSDGRIEPMHYAGHPTGAGSAA